MSKNVDSKLPNTLELYDRAVRNKLTRYFSNVIGFFPDRAMFESNNESKVALPLVSYYRLSNLPIFPEMQSPEFFLGWRSGEYNRLQTIDIDLRYTIDLWAKSRNEVDQLFYDLLFILNYMPYIKVDLGDELGVKAFSLALDEVDYISNLYESSVDNNKIYRYTLTYVVNRAKLLYKLSVDVIDQIDTDITLLNEGGN